VIKFDLLGQSNDVRIVVRWGGRREVWPVMTLNIQLVNMPFASLNRPSIALAQLRKILENTFDERVNVQVHYLNHPFGKFLGTSRYNYICESGAGLVTGLGDWIFREVAFPSAPDNSKAYLNRFRYHFDKKFADWLMNEFQAVKRDLSKFLDELIIRYRIADADIVGLTSMFAQNVPNIALAQRLRSINSNQIVVMGGANCEGAMGMALAENIDVFDFIFSGYGLVSFPEFVGNLLAGDREKCHQIDGVLSKRNIRSFSRTAAGKSGSATGSVPGLLPNGIAQIGKELDINTPIELDYDDFFDSIMQNFSKPLPGVRVMFETSRGCWWGERAHCTFCGLNSTEMSYRAMKPDLATKMIQGLIKRYGDRASVFYSVDNIIPTEYFDTVFENLKLPPHISLFYEVKADLTEDQVRKLASCGVTEIQPGVEALATSTLKLMKKGTTAFGNIRLLMSCRKYGVNPHWNLLIGFPDESGEIYERYLQVLPQLFHLPPPMGAFPVRFDRFSPYFCSPEKYGLILEPYAFYEYVYPLSKEALGNLAYYFQDSNYGASYIGATAKMISKLRDIIAQWRLRWKSGITDAPRLAVENVSDSYCVFDTRGDVPRRIPLTDRQFHLLREIASPKEETSIREMYGGDFDAIQHHGFTFCERGRVVSIVADDLPQTFHCSPSAPVRQIWGST